MAPFFKILIVSMTVALSVIQITSASPCSDVGDSSSDYSSGGCGGYTGSDSETSVPVAPVTITPETDFLPINNVQPIVNVLQTKVHDYSGEGQYDCEGKPDCGCEGAYGHGLGHYDDYYSEGDDSGGDYGDDDCDEDCDDGCDGDYGCEGDYGCDGSDCGGGC